MTSSKRLTNISIDWDLSSILALVLAVELGAFVRLVFVVPSDFPLHDGGLFYAMTQDLLRSNYTLPVYTSYNSAGIPFAYPPFPFFIAAFLSDLMRWPLIEVFRLLPPIISILAIPVFYVLSRAMLRSRAQAALAVCAFALLPRSFLWHIIGGGLARSLGFLFSLLTLLQAYLLYTHRQRRFALSTILFASLTVLSHPEKAWCTAFSAGLLFLFYGRNREGFYNSLLVAGGVLALTAPWWATIVGRHGLSPFLSASQTGSHSWYSWIPPLTFSFADELLSGLLPAVGALGVFVCIADKKLLLPIWLVATFILQPRAALTYSTAPLAMLIGIGIDRVILPGINQLSGVNRPPASGGQPVQENGEMLLARKLKGVLPKVLLGFLLVHALVSALRVPDAVWSPLEALTREERDAMRWVAANTPETSSFLVITSYGQWAMDRTSEWFPALAERVSLTTIQGTEWLPDHQFHRRQERYEALQECAAEGASCLENWEKQTGVTFTHVYIPKSEVEMWLVTSKDLSSSLRNSLRASAEYDVVYDGPGATVFARRSVFSSGRSSGLSRADERIVS